MNNIDLLSQTKTTSQILRHYTLNPTYQLEEDMKTCSKGMYLALQHILCKGVITPRIPTPERVEVDLKDIIQSLRGED